MSIDWKKLVGELVQARPQLELPKRLKLPVLPQSVIAFTAIADDPNAGPWEMAVPLEADSALTSELLRQVNSAAVGLRQRVVSVPQAINLLGPRRTKTLVLTSALQTAAAPGEVATDERHAVSERESHPGHLRSRNGSRDRRGL